jgi:hypothetical protein
MYYLYWDGQQLLLIESELGAVLTTRLLLHARPHARDELSRHVYGCISEDDIVWFTEKKPVVLPLCLYVEPRTFNDDKEGRYWSLLSKEDAKALHKHWKGSQQYNVKSDDKQNYYKNGVDHFEWQMESKWSKQAK